MKISLLPDADPIGAGDKLTVLQGGILKKSPWSLLITASVATIAAAEAAAITAIATARTAAIDEIDDKVELVESYVETAGELVGDAEAVLGDMGETYRVASDVANAVALAVVDSRGHPFMTVLAAPKSPLVTNALTLGKYDWEGMPIYSQSYGTGVSSNGLLSTNEIAGLKMPSTGMRQNTSAANLAVGSMTVVPAVESAAAPEYETPCRGLLEGAQNAVLDRHGLSYAQHGVDFIGWTSGLSGVPLGSLIKGQVSYTRFMAVVQRFKDLATAAGKTFGVRGIGFFQGQSGPFAGYGAMLETLAANLDADIRAITGQSASDPVRLMLSQECGLSFYTGGGNADTLRHVAQEQYRVSQSNPLIKLVNPDYFINVSDGVHPFCDDSKLLGAMAGMALIQECFEDGGAWERITPISVKAAGRVITIKFSTPAALMFDVGQVVDDGAKGFKVHQSDGTTERTISDVQIKGTDTVQLFLAANYPVGGFVSNAWGGPWGASTYAGRVTGARGCLRADLTKVFSSGYYRRQIHPWAPMFRMAL